MNPNQPPTDADNDVHSLEGNSTMVENTAKNTDNDPLRANSLEEPDTQQPGVSTPQSTTPVAPLAPLPAKKKISFFKRIWGRFNIYLLLFILIFLVAAAVVIILTIRGNKAATDTTNTIGSQGLTEETLKQLSNSETTIGNSSQILNIESNAIFSGAVLIKKDLEVAGSIKVNGALALPGITVSGSSSFNQIQASTLNLSGAATVNGTLTARNGLSVNGNGNFTGSVSATQLTTGSLQLNGDLILTHHITGGGAIPGLNQGIALGGGGTASISGSDTSGSIAINTGSSPGAGCFATVNFTRAYNGTPHVIVTPIGAAAGALDFYVNRSSSNFSVCTTSAPPGGQAFGFDYMIMN
jgi:cytoskeletal protein CcmA (bactofilin family)